MLVARLARRAKGRRLAIPPLPEETVRTVLSLYQHDGIGARKIARTRGFPLGTVGAAELSKLQEITKEAVGIHVLLTRLLFGDGILRSLLRRVSLAKPTSALLRF